MKQDTVNQSSSTVLALLMMGKISEQSSSFTQRLGKQGKGGMLDISFLCLQADSSALHPMVGVCLNKAQKDKSRQHSSSLPTTTRKHHGTLNLLLPSCSQACGGTLPAAMAHHCERISQEVSLAQKNIKFQNRQCSCY